MGRKTQKTQSNLVVAGIFVACCFALYCLLLRIGRLMELSEKDRTSPSETVITTVTYVNSSFSGESSAAVKFLFHSQGPPPTDLFCDSRNPVGKLMSPVTTELLGPSRIFMGTCDVLEPGFSVELRNDQFSATLDPDLFPPRRHSIACLSLAFLYDDIRTLRVLLKYYSNEVSTVEIYVASWHDAVFKETEKYPNVHVIWWPLLQASRNMEKEEGIQLDADSYHQTMEASFGDCWLRNGPLVEKISFVDIGQIGFEGGKKRGKMGEKIELFRKDWRMRTLVTGRVTEISENSLTVAESCRGRCGGKKLPATTRDDKPEKSSIVLKRLPSKISIQNSYDDRLKSCASSGGHSSKARKLLDKKNEDDPCYFKKEREGYTCRVASQITKRMFSGEMKVSVVQKRSMLRFYNGCQ